MDKRKKWLLAGCIVVTGVTAVLWLKGYFEVKEPIRVLERNPPGMGDKEIQMEFQTDQGSFPVNLKLAERSYREDEMETIFDQGCVWLDSVWLGENTSSQTVIYNLYFPTEVETLVKRDNISYNISLPVRRAIFLQVLKKPYFLGLSAHFPFLGFGNKARIFAGTFQS